MRQQIIDLLNQMKTPSVFMEIAAGALYPPVTDYYLKPMPVEGSFPLPLDLVDGHDIVPVLSDHDMYSIYCIDRDTLEIIVIDIEEPWPPINKYCSWRDLAADIIRIFEENDPQAVPIVKQLFSQQGCH